MRVELVVMPHDGSESWTLVDGAATRQLIDRAEESGQERLAEMNRTVQNNLLRIITSLETRLDDAPPSIGQPTGGSRAS